MKHAVLEMMMTLVVAGGFALPAQAGPTGGDLDMDGVANPQDICSHDPQSPNPNFCDTDMDGYGNACDADLNNDGVVGGPDLGPVSASFGMTGAPGFVAADINCDGVVGGPDLGLFSSQFGGPPGPSGLSCAGFIPCP